MRFIAFEGPSFAGKTELISAARLLVPPARIGTVPCFVAAAAPAKCPRTPAHTLEDELRAIEFFLKIESERIARVREQVPDALLVLMDRSVHTLLAHTKAIVAISGVNAYEAAYKKLLSDSRVTWPELVFYLDASQELLQARYRKNSVDTHGVFVDPIYNQGFRDYFVPNICIPGTKTVCIDAAKNPSELASEVVRTLIDQGHLGRT